MKRSVALDSISRILDTNDGTANNRMFAESILNYLELVGMLPPYFIPEDTDEENLIMGWKGVNEWEDEDANKSQG